MTIPDTKQKRQVIDDMKDVIKNQFKKESEGQLHFTDKELLTIYADLFLEFCITARLHSLIYNLIYPTLQGE